MNDRYMVIDGMSRQYFENLCRKLRKTHSEFGADALENAFMIGTYKVKQVSNLPYYTCPTIVNETLGGVDFKVARFFEEV